MKPLQLSFFIVFIFLQSSLLAQCPTGEVYLENQQDIADFIADFPNCTELSTLEISDDVTDISGLSNLTKILKSLEGLNRVVYIEDDITITDNQDLGDGMPKRIRIT